MKVVIGIDQATLTGWAVLDTAGKYIDSGVFDTRGSGANRGESPIVKNLRFEKWFTELCANPDWTIAIVCHEQTLPSHMLRNRSSWATTDFAIGLKTIMQMHCQKKKIVLMNAMPATVKKFATGNGRAGKPEMIDVCNDWLSDDNNISQYCTKKRITNVFDDNESDAIHIARYAAGFVTESDK